MEQNILEESFDEVITNLEKAFKGSKSESKQEPVTYTQRNRSRIQRMITQAMKNGKVDFHEASMVESFMNNGKPIPEELLEKIGYGGQEEDEDGDQGKIVKKAMVESGPMVGKMRYDLPAKKKVLRYAVAALEKGKIELRQYSILEDRLNKAIDVPESFLRSIGLNTAEYTPSGEISRAECMTQLQKAVDGELISIRELSIAEDRLNQHRETPESILKSLEDYIVGDESQGKELSKLLKSVS